MSLAIYPLQMEQQTPLLKSHLDARHSFLAKWMLGAAVAATAVICCVTLIRSAPALRDQSPPELTEKW